MEGKKPHKVMDTFMDKKRDYRRKLRSIKPCLAKVRIRMICPETVTVTDVATLDIGPESILSRRRQPMSISSKAELVQQLHQPNQLVLRLTSGI